MANEVRTNRPDLEALPFKNPGFIGDSIFPRLNKAVKAGTVYYSAVAGEGTAETTRALADSVTYNALSSASTTYSVNEKIYRAVIDDSEIEQCGGILAAQQKGARVGKRACMSKVEALAIAATFGDATIQHADILASLLKAIGTASEVLMDKGNGKLALFGARRMIQRIKRYSEVTSKMIYTGVLATNADKDVRNITDEILAGALGVDTVLAGPSDWLGSGNAYDGMLGLCVLADGSIEPDEEAQLGRLAVLNVDGGSNVFECSSWYSNDRIAEVVDTRAWVDLKVFNKDLVYILKGVDESNAVTTTAA